MWILACSGEHALEVIYVAVWIGYVHARAVAVFCLISGFLAVLQRWFIPPLILLAMLAIHPAWTVDAFHGDCGDSKIVASWLFTGTSIAIIGWQLVRGAMDRQKLKAANALVGSAEPSTTQPAE